ERDRGQQGRRRAGGVDRDVRVEHVERRRRGVRGAARPAQERIEQPQDAVGRRGEQGAEPQPVHDPEGDPRELAQREPRRHRKEVAAVLAAEDVPERAGRRPRRGYARQELAGVDVEVDLRVGDDLPRSLGHRERQARRGQAEGDRPVTGGPPRNVPHEMADADHRLAASSVGPVAAPLCPPCVLASRRRRLAISRVSSRGDPLAAAAMRPGRLRSVPRPMRRPVLLCACALLAAGPTVLAFVSGGYFEHARLVALAVAAVALAAAALGAPRAVVPAAAPGRAALAALAAYAALVAIALTSPTLAFD